MLLRPRLPRRRPSMLRHAAALLAVIPGPLAAQATELGRQSLGRPYWHVFIAYALVVVLIGGWVFSIARRLARLEGRLPDDGE